MPDLLTPVSTIHGCGPGTVALVKQDVSSLYLMLPGGAAAQSSVSAVATPEWIQIVPPGVFHGRDGRGPYRVEDPDALIAASMAEGKLALDENHATDLAAPGGGASPARGWMTEMAWRGDGPQGGLWARVDWNESGRTLMADRAYRGVSPVFTHEKDGRLTRILRAALTNTPNIRELASLHAVLPSLSAETIDEIKRRIFSDLTAEERRRIPKHLFAVPDKEELLLEDRKHVELAWDMVDRTEGLTDSERAEARRRILARAKELGMDTSGWSKAAHSQGAEMDIATVRQALGLPDTADEAACLAAMKEGREQQVALQAQIDANAKTMVPLEKVTALQTQLDTLTADRAHERAVAYVDQAIADGKPIAPVREQMIALHASDPAKAEEMISKMPSIHARRGEGGRFVSGNSGEPGGEMMSEEDKAVAQRMGLDPKAFAEHRKKMRDERMSEGRAA